MSVETLLRDPMLLIRADVVRGSAAYTRDAATDLIDSARALRAKGQVLRGHVCSLREASVALQDESEELLRRVRRERALRSELRGS